MDIESNLFCTFFEAFPKLNSYPELNVFIILLLVYLIITKNFKNSILIFIPLFFLAIIVGNERINIIGFTFITFILMKLNKLHHPLYIALLIYFIFKSFNFISNIVNYGDGFI